MKNTIYTIIACFSLFMILSEEADAQLNATSTFEIIHESRATVKYGLSNTGHPMSEIFQRGDAYYQRNLKGYLFLHVNGDAYYDGDLRLDWSDGFVNSKAFESWRQKFNIKTTPSGNHGIAGIIVNGNLTINGDLLNCLAEGGPFLYVRGNLIVEDLIAGGSFIRVGGDIRADGIAIAHYNDGSLNVLGKTTAKVIISDDHDYYSKKGEEALYYFNSYEDPIQVDEEENLILDAKLGSLLTRKIKSWDEMVELICGGHTLLKE